MQTKPLQERVGRHGDKECKSTLVSRNINVDGRRTSIRLEPEMWTALYEVAKRESCNIHDICTLVHIRKKLNTSLTAAIRVFIMLYFRSASTEDGHKRAGHGNFEFMRSRAKVSNRSGYANDGQALKNA